MKRHATLRAVLVPAVSLVAASITGTYAAFASSQARTQAATIDRERGNASLVRSVGRLHAATVHTKVGVWAETLGHRDDYGSNQRALLRSHLADAARAGLPASDLKEMRADIARLETANDGKARNGAAMALLENTTNVIESWNRTKGDAPFEDAVAMHKSLEAIGWIHDDVVSVRAARNVDPSPSTPDLQSYLAGVLTDAPATDAADLTTTLGGGAKTPAVRKAIVAIAESDDARPLAANFLWTRTTRDGRADSTIGTFAEVTESTHESIDAAFTQTGTFVDSALKRLTDRAHRAHHREQLLLGLAVASLLVVMLSLVALTVRVRRSFAQLRSELETDAVSGLLNRAGLRTQSAGWFSDRAGTSLAMAVVDLDYFKLVNDQFGHEVGDSLLEMVGRRLEDGVIKSQTLLGRWGGDEFVILLRLRTGHERRTLGSITDRLVELLSLPFAADDHLLSIGASIGAIACTCSTCEFDDLFRSGDRRLYDVKRDGRGDSRVQLCVDNTEQSLPDVVAVRETR